MKLVILLEYNWCTTGEVGNTIGDKVVYIGGTIGVDLVIHLMYNC